MTEMMYYKGYIVTSSKDLDEFIKELKTNGLSLSDIKNEVFSLINYGNLDTVEAITARQIPIRVDKEKKIIFVGD